MNYRLILACILAGATAMASCHRTDEDELLLARRSPIGQPYAYVQGGSLRGPAVPWSPDPLVRYVWDNPRAEDSLQVFVVHPRKAEVLEGADSFEGLETVSREECRLRVKGEGTLLLDFGVELPAWIEMDSPDLEGQVEMGISEYRGAELLDGPYRKIRKPVQYGNTYRLELNGELYEGVRYGFLYVRQLEKPFTITSLRAVSQVKPTNYTGSFETDNEMLNRIWYTGAWDVKANLRQDCFGAILIDRSDRFSWTGDAYPAQHASLAAFSNYDAVLKNLRWTEGHRNGIETYELYWVESLLDYYMYSGDEEGLRSLLPQAQERLDHAWEIFDQPRRLAFIGWDQRIGTGFDHPDCEEGQWTYRMLAIGAWKHMARVLRMIGEEERAALLEERARQKTNWVNTPGQLARLGMHASADAINAELLSDPASLYHPDLSHRVNRLSYSPFNQCFLLKAMARAGHYGDAMASILDHWGGQIELGATCFLELYRPCWNEVLGRNAVLPFTQCGTTSMAHPWGAGVTAWLSEEVLGIKPLEPGFRTFCVRPHFAGAATRVKGQVMTPHGPARASFDLKTGRHHLSVPQGTTARLCIPLEGMSVKSLELNGQAVTDGRLEDGFLCLNPLPAGEYDIRVKYSGEPAPMETQQDGYVVQPEPLDRETHGEWFRKYGRDGYFIVGGGAEGGDLAQLPPYVESVSFDVSVYDSPDQHRTTNIVPLDSSAMLPVSPEPGARRVLGCYFSRSLHMTPAVVRLKEEGTPYRLALYYADCDRGGRDFVVDIFDEQTRNPIAPSVRIQDMKGGVYLVFQHNRSVRILASFLGGDNSLVNALFFDPAK